MTRPIFIVGCPRSGTTLLRDLLRSHPNLTLPPESQLIPRFYRAYGDPSSDREAWLRARRILHNPRIASWGISTSEAEFAGCRSFSRVIRRLFEVWAAKEGKPRWGDKTPHYVRHLPLILRLFPEAQVIHIIRDGRDAALSWIRAGFEPRNLYVAARMWNDWVAKGRRDGALLPPGTYLSYATKLCWPSRRPPCGACATSSTSITSRLFSLPIRSSTNRAGESVSGATPLSAAASSARTRAVGDQP